MPLFKNVGIPIRRVQELLAPVQHQVNNQVEAHLPQMNALFGAGAGSSKTLGIAHVWQVQSAWCWAACGEMIINFLHGGATTSRCHLVRYVYEEIRHQNTHNCCTSPSVEECDMLGTTVPEIHRVLRHGRVRFDYDEEQLTAEQLKDEIDAGRPVQIGVVWDDGADPPNGHVIVVDGYRIKNGKYSFFVRDPLRWGSSGGPGSDNLVAFSELQSAYDMGRWVETWKNMRREN